MSFTCHWMPLFIIMTTIAAVVVGVSVYPSSYVAVLGGTASYWCPPTSRDLYNVTWTRNGKELREDYDNGVTIRRVGGVSYLNLTNVQAWHNNSHIGCHAFFGDGTPVNASEALLQVQGLPDAVGFHPLEACNSSIDLTWDRPFTLDDRVVTYCMEIIVEVDNETLFSQCGINDTSFTYQLPPRRSCNNFSFIVKPVNGAGNGTAFVQPYFCCQSPVLLVPPAAYPGMTDIKLIMSAPVFTVKLTFVDLDTGENITVGDTNLTVEENNITVTTDPLRANHYYNVTVRASNEAGLTTSYFSLNFIVEATTYIPEPSSTSEAPVNGTEKSDGDGLPTWIVILLVVCAVVLFSIYIIVVPVPVAAGLCIWFNNKNNGYSRSPPQDNDKSQVSGHEQDENLFVSGNRLHRRFSSCVVPGTRFWPNPSSDTPEDTTQETPHLRLKRSHGGHDNQDGDPRDEQRQETPFSIQMSEVTGGDVFLPPEPLSEDGQAAGGDDSDTRQQASK